MITLIEIDGFKTFNDFKVELAPFQVIVGPNGSGKSNLFDALHLLSRLAERDVQSAFQSSSDDPQRLRGDAHDLFTLFPDGQRSDHVRIAVEMLVDRKVQDDFGREVALTYTRLRYEVEVVLRKDKQDWEVLRITHEALRSIPESEDSWCKAYAISAHNGWLPPPADKPGTFISTTLPPAHTRVAEAAPRYDIEPPEPSVSPTPASATIHLHAEGQSSEKTAVADKMKRTLLSSIIDADFPHALAARQEMQSWRFLHLSHAALHQPSSLNAPTSLSYEGGNLAATLARMRAEDKFAFHCVSLDMASLVPGILEIEVEKNESHNEYRILAKTEDNRTISSQVLSDGTLRLLALAMLRNDPEFHGVLALDEPENGVNALSFKKTAHLLREMATDFADPQQMEEPLKQLLITTHSPSFISQKDVIDSLLLAITPSRIQGKNIPSLRITRMIPVITPNSRYSIEVYENGNIAIESATIDTVRQYLESETTDEALDYLKQARTNLNNRGSI